MRTVSSLPLALIAIVLHYGVSKTAAAQAAAVGSAPYRASVTGAGNSHSPVFSADGKHVAFVSRANNLVTNDDLGPHLDLFVRDLAASNTVLVSVSTNGFDGANDNVGLCSISSNGQVVVFDTTASNLAVRDNNRVSDIYAHDLLFGSRWRVTVGVDDEGDSNANGPSYNPLISEDGRYVIFESLASNLVTNDFNGTNDIFICDLVTGEIELVSVNVDGTAGPDGSSHSPSISADGLMVAFISHATNLVEGVTNRLGEVYVRDIAGESNLWAQAAYLSATHTRSPASGALEPYRASEPFLSAEGRYVAFKTEGQTVRFDLERPTNVVVEFFPPSPAVGAVSNYFRFDDNPRLVTSASETPLWLGRDGRLAVIATRTNVTPQPGVLLVDFESFVTNDIHVSWDGTSSNYWFTNQVPGANMILTNAGIPFPGLGKTWTQMPWLTANTDVTSVVFLADATNLVASVTNRTFQIYSVGVGDGAIQLISTNSRGGPCLDLNGVVPASAPDGSLVAWDSPDDDIVPDDLNHAWDVFVRNVDTGETQPISARHPILPAASGIAMSRLDLNPGAISANGQRIAILSLDNTLAPDDTNHWRDLFVRDLASGTNFDVSRSIGRVWYSSQTNFPGTNTAAAPCLSADGRFIAFSGEARFFAGSTNRTIYWRNLQSSSNRVVVTGSQNNPAGVSHPVLSSNGRLVAFHSADIHDSYYSDGNGQSDVFVRLMTPHPSFRDCSFIPFFYAPVFISVAAGTTTTAAGPSVNPAFSPDSGWVLFQSRATNLLSSPIPTQSIHQLYKREVSITSRVTNTCGQIETLSYKPTELISYSTTASPGPSGISIDLPLPGGGANPRFSADARYVAFESSPNLIYRHDLRNGWVVKIITHPDPAFPSLTNRARFTNDLVCSNCSNPTLSAEGRFIAYESLSASGAVRDVSVKDLQTGQEELISVNLSGSGGGNGSSSTPLLSHDARFVVFASRASDLVPGDHNRTTDIFVRDRLNAVMHCLSRNFAGSGTGVRVSSNPVMAADGRTVVFQSFASDLVPGDYNDTRDVFVITLAGPDNDGDGMDDDWEMAYFSTLERGGFGDFDQDSASDRDEFRAGTNPSNDDSILRVLTISPVHDSPGALREATLVWSAVPGRTYRVQFKDSLPDATWMDVPGDVVATTTSASKTHTPSYYTGYFTNCRFYRVLLVQ